MIPYTPEELIEEARKRYAWCEREMQRAAMDLHHGVDWRAALEHVKTLHAGPGGQAGTVKALVDEAAAYVRARGLVTVPPLAEQTWRMDMMSRAYLKYKPLGEKGP